MNQVGAAVVDILDSAGAQYLKASDPDLYRAYLLNVGGTDTLRRYDGTETYWDSVQAILDTFFSSRERAEICAHVMNQAKLRKLPEFRGFLMRALAERRLQSLLVAAMIGQSSRAGERSGATRRGG
jgi:hypothetical protein